MPASLTGATKSVKIDAVEVILIAAFALLGVTVGSFLNVLIDRLPTGGSPVFPASYCPSCQRRLSPGDLIPVFSYIGLRGRCRYCQAAIPRRVLWVEIATGAVFAFLYWYYGSGAELAVLAFYFSLFIVLLVIDLEHRLILNKVVYPSSLVALAASIFLSQLEVVPDSIARATAGGAIGLGLFFLVALMARGGMGLGDVKMAALIGLIVGFPHVFVALFLAVISGGAVASVLMMVKAKSRKQGIPFGPFLSLGAMTTLLWGSDILNWYVGLFH